MSPAVAVAVPSPSSSPKSSQSSTSSSSLSFPASQPRPGSGTRWVCPFECGQQYKRSSGRSIRRHVHVCFRAHNPSAATLSDEQLSAIISQQQTSGQLMTGLRRWKMRQPRRLAEALAENDRWDCVWGCGKSYRSTSSRSIQRHANTCCLRSDDRTGDVDVKRLWRQSRERRIRQRRYQLGSTERDSSKGAEADSGGDSASSSPLYSHSTAGSSHAVARSHPMPSIDSIVRATALDDDDGKAERPGFGSSRFLSAALTRSLPADYVASGSADDDTELGDVESDVGLAVLSSWSSAALAASSYSSSSSSSSSSPSSLFQLLPPHLQHGWPSSAPTMSVDYHSSQPQHSSLPLPPIVSEQLAGAMLAQHPPPADDGTTRYSSSSVSSAPLSHPSAVPTHASLSDQDEQMRYQLRLIIAALSIHHRHSLHSSPATQRDERSDHQTPSAAQHDVSYGGMESGGINSLAASRSNTNAATSSPYSLYRPDTASHVDTTAEHGSPQQSPDSNDGTAPSLLCSAHTSHTPAHLYSLSPPPLPLPPSPPPSAASPTAAQSADGYLLALSRFLQSSTWYGASSSR